MLLTVVNGNNLGFFLWSRDVDEKPFEFLCFRTTRDDCSRRGEVSLFERSDCYSLKTFYGTP